MTPRRPEEKVRRRSSGPVFRQFVGPLFVIILHADRRKQNAGHLFQPILNLAAVIPMLIKLF